MSPRNQPYKLLQQNEEAPALASWNREHNPTNRTSRAVWLGPLLASVFWVAVFSIHWQITHPARNIVRPKGSYHELKFDEVPGGMFEESYGRLAENARLLTCGFSLEEAQALDCTYDVLAGRWLPDFCADRFSIEAYQADGSWTGFAHRNRTQPLTVREMSETDKYWTSQRDHINHCANLWRRQFDTLHQGRNYLDLLSADKHHTYHCIKYMMDLGEKEEHWENPIPVYVKYSGCLVRD